MHVNLSLCRIVRFCACAHPPAFPPCLRASNSPKRTHRCHFGSLRYASSANHQISTIEATASQHFRTQIKRNEPTPPTPPRKAILDPPSSLLSPWRLCALAFIPPSTKTKPIKPTKTALPLQKPALAPQKSRAVAKSN